jgi:multidrug efflux system outer membrane protein
MRCVVPVLSLLSAACATEPPESKGPRPSVAPSGQPAANALHLDRSQVTPMYREMLTIDLPNVVQVASLRNIDILQARQRVEASRGQAESAAASVFPIIAPGVFFNRVEGVNQSFTGQLVGVNFTTLQPAVLVQSILNPARVYYDVLASRKRLHASEQEERFVVLETIRSSVVQYYDLVLAQSRISVARETVAEAEELLRLARLRVQAGTGVPADDLRAQADLAGRQQDLATALNSFYQASITLASTLYLDATVTLTPKPDQIAATRLVREDLGIDDMLRIAAQWRPDLDTLKNLAAAAAADTKSTLWGGVSPQLQAGYQFGGLTSRAAGESFPLQTQQQVNASAGWTLTAALFGQVRTARATEQQATLETERRLQDARAQVVRSAQDSATNAQLIPIAKQQVEAAAEALRLAQENFGAGTALSVDVLQAEDTLNEARLRYASSVTSYNQSQVNLLAALGLIDSMSLSPSEPSATAPTTQPVADRSE